MLLSQGHCVNVLLDLYSATEDFAIRWAISDRLNEIRFLSAVEGDDLRADLTAIIELASADVPSELEWSRSALESCLRDDVGSRPGRYSWSAAAETNTFGVRLCALRTAAGTKVLFAQGP